MNEPLSIEIWQGSRWDGLRSFLGWRWHFRLWGRDPQDDRLRPAPVALNLGEDVPLRFLSRWRGRSRSHEAVTSYAQSRANEYLAQVEKARSTRAARTWSTS